MPEQDPQRRPDEAPNYKELDYSSPKAIVDWYHSIGPFTEVVRDEDYSPGNNQLPNSQLFHAASRLYLYSIGSSELASSTSDDSDNEAGRYLMRVVHASNYDERTIDDPSLALEVGVMLLEIDESMGQKESLLTKAASTIFSQIANDPRLERGSGKLGGMPKYEAIRYFHDIETRRIRNKLESGNINKKQALEEYRVLNLDHIKRFSMFAQGNTKASNGEVYEHFVEIVSRYENWKNGDIEKWSIRSARPREDQPDPSVVRDDNNKKLSFDSIIVDRESGDTHPLQAKLDELAGVHEYSELVSIVDTLSALDNVEARDYMNDIVGMIRMAYNGNGSEEQLAAIDEEFKNMVAKVPYFQNKLKQNS